MPTKQLVQDRKTNKAHLVFGKVMSRFLFGL